MDLDPARLLFLDETGAKTNMTRLRGRAPRGQRLVAKVPHGHWKSTTLLAALDGSGVRCSMSLDGPVDRDAFEAFVEKVLAPAVRPGDLVVMDNLSSHKGPRVARLVEAAGGAVLYLPPYSPDLNPIEMAFSQIKQALRSLATRTQEALWGAMQGVLDRVRPADARGYFRHCGYTLHSE
jgi:transposase